MYFFALVVSFIFDHVSSAPGIRAGLNVSAGGNLGNCGKSSIQQGRIVFGVNAKPGAWPWIVSLKIPGYKSHFCGASLIAPTWVLTASHCVRHKKAWQIEALLGGHDRDRPEGTEQYINVKRIIKHPKFGQLGLQHDIALLQLEKPARLNSRVHIVCLPRQGKQVAIGTNCSLAGWGSITYPGSSHHLLQQTVLPVVNREHCTFIDGFICSGYGKHRPMNACEGDSGGPLVCQNVQGAWVQYGVTSFVVEYCKYYTAFTNISNYVDWIDQYVNN